MPQGETMPDLSTQIETLYRVIRQIRPEDEPRRERGNRRRTQQEQPILRQAPQQGAFRLHAGSARRANRAASVRWIFTFYCFWFSLPLSVWFTSGWIGLFFYWRALAGTARLVELLTRKPTVGRKERGPARMRGFTSTPFHLSPFQLSSLDASPLDPAPFRPIPFPSTSGGARCSAIELP